MKNNDPIHLDPAIRDAFDPEHFRETGHRLVDLLADYLEQAQSRKMQAVLPNINPEEMLEEWKGEFPEKPSEEFLPLIQKILDQSNHLHHPGYVGHQVSAPLPLAADWGRTSALSAVRSAWPGPPGPVTMICRGLPG